MPPVITDWPNPEAGINANSEKVPSTISYDKDGKVKNWGYEVTARDTSLRWLKIMLEAGSEHPKYLAGIADIRGSNEDVLRGLGKTADDVVADFLGELWKYTREDIRKRLVDQTAWESSVQVVLTVPAVWSDAAKDRTLKAAQRAGMPASLMLLSEPEAAALATLTGKAEVDTLKDLISYKVRSVDPFEIEECAIGDGELCGSVYLDFAFLRYIKTKVGEEQYNSIRLIDMKAMRNHFDIGIKRAFDWNSNKEYFIDIRGVKDNELEGIMDEMIKITPWSSICRGATMWGQAHSLREAQRRHHASTTPQRPLLPHLMSPIVKKRLARGNYGFVVQEDYDEARHDPRDRVKDVISGRFKAKGQMIWVVKRGDPIAEGDEPVQYSIFRRLEGLKWNRLLKKREFTEKMYYNGSANPPSRLDAITEGKLRSSGRKIKGEANGKLHYKCDFTFMLRMDLTRMAFGVLFDGKDVGFVEARYIDEVPRLDLQLHNTGEVF
ncbi:hypothetical protein SLS53_005927 [Cytospora paraplurivora]|uniref:Uncharacterized protein n=1 Tax=Cytospora paraplurivora TaxID=2898453 RepID=A0AAN9YFC0_9PEZI